MVINALNETTHEEFCERSINRSASSGMETFIWCDACKRPLKEMS